MEPLFLFKLDEHTGRISRLKISKYEQGKFVSNKMYYRYKWCGATYYVYSNDLDRVKNWRVYSFSDDICHARQLFHDEINAKLDMAYNNYIRYCAIAKKLGIEI